MQIFPATDILGGKTKSLPIFGGACRSKIRPRQNLFGRRKRICPLQPIPLLQEGIALRHPYVRRGAIIVYSAQAGKAIGQHPIVHFAFAGRNRGR